MPQLSSFDPVGVFRLAASPALILALGIVLIVGTFVYQYRRKRQKQESLTRLLQRAPSWQRTNQPCGISARALAGRSAATPRGDRRYGVRYGIGGPLTLAIGGRDTECDASFFQWFSEERHTSRSSNGNTTTSYKQRREVVGMVRLPVTSPSEVRIRSESLFGRIGLTRGGDQVESSEFNRRFRVEGGERAMTVQLLDANLQQVLLERFQGRTIDLASDVLILGGSPDHRDGSLTGVIGEYPAVREDLERLVAQIPPQFWRAIGADRIDPGA